MAKVEKAIEGSNAVVVLLSKKGAASPFVHQEIGYARRAKKLIIPLVEPGSQHRRTGDAAGSRVHTFLLLRIRGRAGHGSIRNFLKKLLDQQIAKARQREALVVGLAVIALLIVAADSDSGLAAPAA